MEQVGEMDCTNSEAAKLIGIDYNIYKKIMEFGKIPKPVILMRIADHFQLSVDYLLGRSKIPHFEPASPRSSFSERYAKLKREYNMTDYAVAQKLHISTSYTSAWKKYGFVPSPEQPDRTLRDLSRLFGFSPRQNGRPQPDRIVDHPLLYGSYYTIKNGFCNEFILSLLSIFFFYRRIMPNAPYAPQKKQRTLLCFYLLLFEMLPAFTPEHLRYILNLLFRL